MVFEFFCKVTKFFSFLQGQFCFFVGELNELSEWLPQKKEVVFIRLIRPIRRRLNQPSAEQQFLGGLAGGGGDAEEVGAAGPGGDVEGDGEFGIRSAEFGDFAALEVVGLDARDAEGGEDLDLVAGGVGVEGNGLGGLAVVDADV